MPLVYQIWYTRYMKTLKQYIIEAEKKSVAIGHFNFTTHEMLRAIFDGARELSEEIKHPFSGGKIPVVVGVSEGERDWYGLLEAASMVATLRELYDYPIFINADHSYSLERAQAAIEAGYDMVIFDGAEEDHEKNLATTQQVVAYRNEVHPECLIEAELGFIGSGSNVKDEVPEGVGPETMTKPEEAKEFVKKTGIDLLAPSVGNLHGMVRSGNPALDHDRIKSVRKESGVPLVLHGGSGVADEDFVKAIKAGISLIHISTELRRAYREGLDQSLKENDTIAPYRYMKQPYEQMKKVVKERIKLFLS
jgi:fructose-bisphosphate aldolase class II